MFNKYNHNHYPFFFFFIFFAWQDLRFLISLAPQLSIWFQCHCTMTSDLSLDHMIVTIRSLTLTVQMINTDAMYSSKHMCQFEFQVGKTELTEKYLQVQCIKLPLSSIIRDIKEKERNKTITWTMSLSAYTPL